MSDPTEFYRRLEQAELNANAGVRATVEAQYGQVWDTEELTRDFAVQSFLAPYVLVQRRADGVRGTLRFQHQPRLYFDFAPE